MPSKILPANKSSRRRLNSVSVSNSRQEATPASAEVGPSPSSTPSVSLRGDAESAEVVGAGALIPYKRGDDDVGWFICYRHS